MPQGRSEVQILHAQIVELREQKVELLAAVKNWMTNGHIKGCYHAEYDGLSWEFCQAGCKRLRAAIAKCSPQAPK